MQQLRAEGEGDVVILGSRDGKRRLGGVPEPRSFRLKSIDTTSKDTIAAVYTNDFAPPDRPTLTG